MSEIDKAIEELLQQMADIKAEIARREHELTAVIAEIRGLERAKSLFTPPEPAGRQDVQGPVMACFGSGSDATWVEAGLVSETDLPAGTVHKFLLRAVRDGKLVCEDGVYSLPAPPVARAAE